MWPLKSSLISILLISCNTNQVEKKIELENEYNFINTINTEELELPAKLNLVSNREDSLFSKSIHYGDSLVFSIYIKNSNIDTLKITDADGFAVYREGDLDSDGLEEIGIMEAYPTSSCRTYSIYGIENNKWKEKYSILTHLADRELGVNYFRNMGNKLRIIQAKRDDCCQCLGLDTIYIKN